MAKGNVNLVNIFVLSVVASAFVSMLAFYNMPDHDIHPEDHPLHPDRLSRHHHHETNHEDQSVGRSRHHSSHHRFEQAEITIKGDVKLVNDGDENTEGDEAETHQKHHPKAVISEEEEDAAKDPFELEEQKNVEEPHQNELQGGTPGNPNYHMVFSTSCSPFQNWQSMVFFYSAWKVKQPGTVTRIASACKDGQKEELLKFHKKFILPLSPDFHVHFTPDWGFKNNNKYCNKPFGLLDWFENALGFPQKADKYDDDIIMIVDPDMMLLRPILHKFDIEKVEWRVPGTDNKYDTVAHGKPISQIYGFGSQWLTSMKGNITYVTGGESQVNKMERKEAADYYPAGPPYLATGRDMYQIAKKWVEFVPRFFEVFTGFMAEMHSYSLAAAYLNLPHQLADSFMISDPDGGKEGWNFLHKTNREDVCKPDAIVEDDLPYVFHFCQRCVACLCTVKMNTQFTKSLFQVRSWEMVYRKV